jgi:hypothetical protein
LLHVAGNVRITGALYDGNNAAGTSGQILSSTGTATDWVSKSDLGLVDGSGTANFVSKWSDTDTLTNSLIFDNGTNVGIGNTSPAAKLDVTGTLAVSGNATFDTNTLFVDAASNEVGIGTTSPSGKLHISAPSGVASLGSTALAIRDSAAPNYGFDFTLEGVASGDMSLVRTELDVQSQVMTFKRSNGNVGIGTTSPTTLGAGITSLDVAGTAGGGLTTRGTTVTGELIAIDAATGFYISTKTNHPIVLRTNDVERVRITNNGLTFNGDTAAANALDDYEEGTWTMGITFGGADVGVTYGDNTGTYTKIGRQVTVNGLLVLTSKGSSVGAANIKGLPFTIANTSGNYSAVSLRLANITFANQFMGYGGVNSTIIDLNEITILGAVTGLTDADFANDSSIMVSLTYFV